MGNQCQNIPSSLKEKTILKELNH